MEALLFSSIVLAVFGGLTVNRFLTKSDMGARTLRLSSGMSAFEQVWARRAFEMLLTLEQDYWDLKSPAKTLQQHHAKIDLFESRVADFRAHLNRMSNTNSEPLRAFMRSDRVRRILRLALGDFHTLYPSRG